MENLSASLTEAAKALTEAAEAFREGNAAIAAHTKALQDEREAFAQNANRIIRAIKIAAGVSAIPLASILAVQFLTMQRAGENASRIAGLIDTVQAIDRVSRETRAEAREARSVAEDAPRLEIVPPPASASAASRGSLVVVAPVARPSHAKAGAPSPPPSASVVLPVDVTIAPTTAAAGGEK